MLDAFRHWLQISRPALETQGIALEFCGDTREQTVKTNTLNFIYAQYDGGICLWETGDCNITLVDMGADALEPMKECASFVEFHLGNPAELEMVLPPFFEILGDLPRKNISARAALLSYWQSLPVQICINA